MPEIRKYAGATTPVLLIGTKEDLTDAPENRSKRIDFKNAQRAANEVNLIFILFITGLHYKAKLKKHYMLISNQIKFILRVVVYIVQLLLNF